jgi:hypothetical protein
MPCRDDPRTFSRVVLAGIEHMTPTFLQAVYRAQETLPWPRVVREMNDEQVLDAIDTWAVVANVSVHASTAHGSDHFLPPRKQLIDVWSQLEIPALRGRETGEMANLQQARLRLDIHGAKTRASSEWRENKSYCN